MLQRLLENILTRYIGAYVQEINHNNLKMSIYSGLIDMSNLALKKNLLQRLNIPIELSAGRIKKLHVTVPWNALSSKPVQIEIEGLQLLACMLHKSQWQEFIEKNNLFETIKLRLVELAK